MAADLFRQQAGVFYIPVSDKIPYYAQGAIV